MVETLRKRFAHLDLTFSIGGQISFDVFPKASTQQGRARGCGGRLQLQLLALGQCAGPSGASVHAGHALLCSPATHRCVCLLSCLQG